MKFLNGACANVSDNDGAIIHHRQAVWLTTQTTKELLLAVAHLFFLHCFSVFAFAFVLTTYRRSEGRNARLQGLTLIFRWTIICV